MTALTAEPETENAPPVEVCPHYCDLIDLRLHGARFYCELDAGHEGEHTAVLTAGVVARRLDHPAMADPNVIACAMFTWARA